MSYKLCWCVSRNWFLTHKKGTGKPIVRKLFVNDVRQRMEHNPTKHMKQVETDVFQSMTTFDQDNF
jgi:hypothetical protein